MCVCVCERENVRATVCVCVEPCITGTIAERSADVASYQRARLPKDPHTTGLVCDKRPLRGKSPTSQGSTSAISADRGI
jgi:hypothetical protein